VHSLEIVSDANERPLCIYFHFPTQQELTFYDKYGGA